MEGSKSKFGITSMWLHIMAMAFMLCDHLWGTVVPGNDWLTMIGRLAFPIFAFMIVEGYTHTRSLKRYVLRLLLFAVITELPFNLAMHGNWIYPFHQNVLWTVLIAIGLIYLNELTGKIKIKWLRIALGIIVAGNTLLFGWLIGTLSFVDYHGEGVLMVLVFYFFRKRKWWCYVGQLVCMWFINMEMLGGRELDVEVFGKVFFIAQQGIAVFSLIPIWLYRGRQGYHAKWFKYFCYAFYPAHLLILAIIKMLTQ